LKRRDFLDHVGWTGAGIAFTLTSAGTFASAALADGGSKRL
jgi:hypothetical protein